MKGEAKLLMLKLTSVFYHLPSVGPKQMITIAHLRDVVPFLESKGLKALFTLNWPEKEGMDSAR